jgi:F-type H+-transporting ATPase subunit epsilon
MLLKLDIVTPHARVYSDTVDTVVLPTKEGEVGILPGHIPLITQIQSGELRITKDGKLTALVVGDGFAQVIGDRVSVLAQRAIEEEKIDETAAEEAIKRAQIALASPESLQPAEVEHNESIVRFNVAQLGIKRRGK